MKLLWTLAVGFACVTTAYAQTSQDQPDINGPIQQQWQQEGSRPVQRAPTAPALPQPGGQNQAQAPVGAPPATVERPNVWLSAGEAKLEALDKVDAVSAQLTIKVGQSGKFGSLTITVKACMVRPTDQPADAAVYLDVTDGHPDSPGFSGWMLEDEPSVSMMQHPVYDLRVKGCA